MLSIFAYLKTHDYEKDLFNFFRSAFNKQIYFHLRERCTYGTCIQSGRWMVYCRMFCSYIRRMLWARCNRSSAKRWSYIRACSMFNNDVSCALLMMMCFTYRYISIAIILLFACTSFLAIISHNGHILYAYIVPCILSGFILTKRANKIAFNDEFLIIEGLYKKEFFHFKSIRKFETFKDTFFYGKTLGVNIYLKDGSLKKIYIGTLNSSYIPNLSKLLNSKL